MHHQASIDWLRAAFPDVSRETWINIDRFEAVLRARSQEQNLVSRSTLADLRWRHIVDSAQLLSFGPREPATWLDLGSGAGFPGLVVSALSKHQVSLVESRRLRVEFLKLGVDTLGVGHRTNVIGSPLERVPTRLVDVISARAFAPLDRLLSLAHRFSTENTIWILPKGRGAQSELDQVADAWQGDFRLEPSVTDPEARIIVATGVQPRGKRRKST